MNGKIKGRRLVTNCVVLMAGFLAIGPAFAQGYPSKPIELVVPYSAGGSTDQLGRAFADASHKHTSQPFIIINKPGASGSIATTDVINAKADGYRVGLLTPDVLIAPLMGLAKFSYTDLEPVVQLNYDPATIVVRSDATWKSIGELIAAAKGGKNLQVGTSGNATVNHLAAAALSDKTGANLTPVPFQGAAPAVLALLGGHIDAIFATPSEVSSYVKAGKLKILMQMADKRSKSIPDVPTGKESGIDVTLGSWRYLAVSKKTPPEVVAQLRKIAADTAKDPAFGSSLEKLDVGFEYRNGDDFKAVLDKDYAFIKELITRLNIKP